MKRQVSGEHDADFSSNASASEIERPGAQVSRAPWLGGSGGYRADWKIGWKVGWIRGPKPLSCVVHRDNENTGRLEGTGIPKGVSHSSRGAGLFEGAQDLS